MSPAESATARRQQRENERPIGAATLAAAASVVALWPYTSVVEAGRWTLTVLSVILFVGLAGIGARALFAHRSRFSRNGLALLAQIAAATCTLTAMISPGGAILGLIPLQPTFTTFGVLAPQAAQEVAFGVAPLADTLALQAMLGLGFAIVAILIDHLVALRLPLLTGLLVAVVGAVPMIVTLGGANVAWFVLLAIVMLLLFRHSVRHDRTLPRRAPVSITAGIGAAAVALALVITPVLPVSATWIGVGTSINVNPTLRLGEDLRRPIPSEVMTLATAADIAPYLRIATLSRFDGSVWLPDESERQSLSDGFGEPEWTEQITTSDQRTSIRVIGISSSWLPVPYPATRINGISNAWDVMVRNRTVVSDTADAGGADYTVTSTVVEPTLEQIQAASAGGETVDGIPVAELPSVIADTAQAVTAEATNDYDRLIALQRWFRGEFTYSLETPVDEGFDGTGTDAVVDFLEERSGYCIHFAGAFALMAQTLDMPVRIVVGYLPGQRTDETRGEEFIYSVSSDQLHAWPEVRFEGIGWVPFEPTASLGVPTGFAATVTEGDTTTGPSEPEPSAAPSTAPTTAPELEREDVGGTTGGADTLRQLDPTPVLLVCGGILLVLLLPALVRIGVRMLRRRRVRHGDALTAWGELRDTLVDLRLPVTDADSPRERGAYLVERGADVDAVHILVAAVEQASFARDGGDGRDLTVALSSVSAALHRSVDRRDRALALFVPRSLFAQRPSRAPALS